MIVSAGPPKNRQNPKLFANTLLGWGVGAQSRTGRAPRHKRKPLPPSRERKRW